MYIVTIVMWDHIYIENILGMFLYLALQRYEEGRSAKAGAGETDSRKVWRKSFNFWWLWLECPQCTADITPGIIILNFQGEISQMSHTTPW